MRLATALAAIALAAVPAVGCGSSAEDGSAPIETRVPSRQGGSGAPVGAAAKTCETEAVDAEGLRATGVSCELARRVMHDWRQKSSCASPAGASRVSCSSRSYRCTGTRTDRGTAVSCSRPGRSVAFVAKR
jgi:hypothetical protein